MAFKQVCIVFCLCGTSDVNGVPGVAISLTNGQNGSRFMSNLIEQL